MQRTHLAVILVFAIALLAGSPAGAATSGVVVSQVFAAGGNAGATFTSDYVELFNRGSSSIDVTGWSLQYATATGTSWSPTVLTGNLAAGRRYLVQLGSGGTGGSAVPAPDATGTVNLAANGGKVALVQDAAALTCGASAGSCSAVATVRDLVGYGAATDYEGAGPAPALTSSTAAVRAGDGCTDGNSSAADFSIASPTPRNSSAAATPCGGAPPTNSASQSANVVLDVQPVISLTLDRPTVSFGSVVSGETPAPVPERVSVTSTGPSGYVLGVHRAAFTPVDLPLGLSATAPAGAQLAGPFGAGAVVAVPIPPATELLLGITSAASAAGGDVWPTTFAFISPFPALPPGHYSSSVTYTVIGR